MIDIDNGPLVLLGIILFVYIMPFIYSFFVDDYDKTNPPTDEYHSVTGNEAAACLSCGGFLLGAGYFIRRLD